MTINAPRTMLRACQHCTATRPALSHLRRTTRRAASTLPPPSHFAQRSTRFRRFDTPNPNQNPETSSSLKSKNPLNYVDNEKARLARNAVYKKRIWLYGAGIAVCLSIQLYLVLKLREHQTPSPSSTPTTSTGSSSLIPDKSKTRLDAPPGAPQPASDTPIIISKPGESCIKLDQRGVELVETGTSTIPHFPRHIHIPPSSDGPSGSPSGGAAPAAQVQLDSSIPTPSDVEDDAEEYTLLGLGIRTVSFLSIQVYVLGLYVRTSDLDRLQACFVKSVNPAGSSLIPSEKESLKADLLADERSAEIWDRVLREARVRSAVRIVPTRGTDFGHLRDGWVRGITARTQEASRKALAGGKEGEGKLGGVESYDDEKFGEAMNAFKALMGGKGKAPRGAVVLLTRDEKGILGLRFADQKKGKEGAEVRTGAGEVLGSLEDERISRLVWLGYLGGKNVSSKGARESIVNGVMDLVERPLGTVGSQVL